MDYAVNYNYNPYNPYSSYLCHYGVRGQKKGERRFQNEDGTWTELGKERRRKQLAKDDRFNESGGAGKVAIAAERNTKAGAVYGALAGVAGTLQGLAQATAMGYTSAGVLAVAGLATAVPMAALGAGSVALGMTAVRAIGQAMENRRRTALGEEKMTWSDKQYYEKHKDRYADK